VRPTPIRPGRLAVTPRAYRAETMLATFPIHGAIYAKELAEDLFGQGYSEHQVFHGSGLSSRMLEPDKPVVAFDRVASFFEHAALLTGDDMLGFVRGQKREMRRSGMISYVGVSSPTVLDYLQNVVRFRRVFTDAIDVKSEELESKGLLEWQFNVPHSINRRQYVEFSASGLVHALRQASDCRIRPDLVTFRHARNANTLDFEQYFGCDVRFGDDENSYHFKPEDLALPLVTADDELYKVLRNCCENTLRTKAQNLPLLVVQVERMISDRLTKGEATQEDVARSLGMSPRTLSRRLAEEGLSFFKVLEGLRKSLAKTYLRDSNLVLAEIAYLLGYSGMSSFSDAFKRWNGISPGQYRNQ
jgi:AraC-like DNA-binding protein